MQLISTGAPRRFVQIWPSNATGEWVIREGTLGRPGRVRETGLRPESASLEEVAAPFLADGFFEFDDDTACWVVAQFPTRTAAADRRHIEHATQWISATLDERGLGHVDGHDRGKRAGDGKIVVNIYALVKDPILGAEAVMAALRGGRADPQRASIAYRSREEDAWTVRYERTSGKLPGPFVI